LCGYLCGTLTSVALLLELIDHVLSQLRDCSLVNVVSKNYEVVLLWVGSIDGLTDDVLGCLHVAHVLPVLSVEVLANNVVSHLPHEFQARAIALKARGTHVSGLLANDSVESILELDHLRDLILLGKRRQRLMGETRIYVSSEPEFKRDR